MYIYIVVFTWSLFHKVIPAYFSHLNDIQKSWNGGKWDTSIKDKSPENDTSIPFTTYGNSKNLFPLQNRDTMYIEQLEHIVV